MVVVLDSLNHRLVLWRLGDGTVWKELGSEGAEPGQFTCPLAVVLTSTGALVVTDENRVQVLTVDGAVLCVLDPRAVAHVGRLGDLLYGVAVCAGTDEILVTDLDNHRVVALTWSSPSQVCQIVKYLIENLLYPFFFYYYYSSFFRFRLSFTLC